METIYLGSDHAGFSLKKILQEYLIGQGYTTYDCGTDSEESCDYPLFAHTLCEHVQGDPGSLGLLVCGTGIGMSMAANRHLAIRAAICTTEMHAEISRKNYAANVLCLGSRMTGLELAKRILDTFLNTPCDKDKENFLEYLAKN